MELNDKKIYLALSPHINYYHSYRGDSRGATGFGKDLKLMRQILDKLDEIEDQGFSFGTFRISWDYGDTFWSIQLQKEYQQDVLDRVIERCKKGKDEVLIGSWGNCAQPALDTEELIQDHKWFLENSMGIGVNQLFKGRIAPYARTQETMFTQGMIELYNTLGIEGICIYYSVYQFDVGRPFLNPRLDWNQRYAPVRFKSSVSNASCLMIPMYGFGDILDYCSLKGWLKFIRKKQKKGDIKGHALVFVNFDMDYDVWIGYKLPKAMNWIPNTKGLMEFTEVIDQTDYVELTCLMDIVPKLPVYGETILHQDAADGNWNGFYSWTQKYNNTKFWTVGQWARWLKCISDTLISNSCVSQLKKEINQYLRGENDLSDSYLKNKILFASTTNFGMAMPFQHPHRKRTAMNYGLQAYYAAENALNLSKGELLAIIEKKSQAKNVITIIPIDVRGVSEYEITPLLTPILVKIDLSEEDLSNKLGVKNNNSLERSFFSPDNQIHYALYNSDSRDGLSLECVVYNPSKDKMGQRTLILDFSDSEIVHPKSNILIANEKVIKNKFLSIKFDEKGQITSFNYNGKEMGCPRFLESALTFGKEGKTKRYSAKSNTIKVLRDGGDGFSASVDIKSKYSLFKDAYIESNIVLTIYSELPYLFAHATVSYCDIKGTACSEDGTSYVEETYDERWREIMPCEVKPDIVGKKNYLRVWKRNFFGRISYYDFNLKDVDKKNADADCLVANVTDGWMALSNREKGMLLGFNSLVAANFAFTPIKMKDKGFGDASEEGQQVRINPFGAYHGKDLHYWTKGTGHGQKIIPKLFGTLKSAAPTYSGKQLEFEMLIAPYTGDVPPEDLQSFANHFSLPPYILIQPSNGNTVITNADTLKKKADEYKQAFNIEEMMNLSYLEWVRKINKDFDASKQSEIPTKGLKLNPKLALMLLIDGLRGK